MNGTPLACLLLMTSCGLPGLESPQYRFTPEFTLYQLSGGAKMQSGSGAAQVDNAKMPARELGQDQRDAGDWGGTLAVGEGISNFEVSYLHVDVDGGTARGILSQGFGALQAGDKVYSTLRGSEIRAAYHARVWDHQWKSGAKLEFAPGAMLANRSLAFRAREINNARTQRINLDDGLTPYLAARARASYKQFAVQLDYAIDPGIHLGGSYEGTMQDMSVSLRYAALPDQDVDLILGWRRFDLFASGSSEGQRWETDWKLEGFFFAVAIGF